MERDDARPRLRMLRPLRRSTDRPGRRLRRGVYLLPSMFTVGNMFCGYACIGGFNPNGRLAAASA